jgi:hypothetical protein
LAGAGLASLSAGLPCATHRRGSRPGLMTGLRWRAKTRRTWQAVERLAGLGYDWHTIMHMIAGLVAEDVHAALAEDRQPDLAGYSRRLAQLPAGWPAPGN